MQQETPAVGAVGARTKPPFRADHVGSLLRPARLHEARADFAAGRIDAAALRTVEDEAIRDIVRKQEDVGLQAATDGEVTVRLHLTGEAIVTRVGPFSSDGLRAELERDPGETVTLRRVLDTVVDDYGLDGDGWIQLTKHVERQEPAS